MFEHIPGMPIFCVVSTFVETVIENDMIKVNGMQMQGFKWSAFNSFLLTARQCPKLVLPKNIQVRCSRENYVGSYCRLTCPRGQSVKGGPSMIVCFRSGRWSRSVAKVTCGKNKHKIICLLKVTHAVTLVEFCIFSVEKKVINESCQSHKL